MKKIIQILLWASLAFSLQIGAQQPSHTVKPWHKAIGEQCMTCHEQEKPTAAGNLKCSTCHGSAQDMVKKTEKLGYKNPHTSIHFGTALPCEECHKEHSAPYNYCTESCHRNWPNNIPGKR